MRKKILLIHHGTGLGGGLVALLGLLDDLKKDYDVTVLCIFESDAIDYLIKRDITVIRPKSNLFYKHFYKIFSHTEAEYSHIAKNIYKFLKYLLFFANKYYFSRGLYKHLLNDFDLVYLNSTFISDWAYIPSKFGKKVIIHVREPLMNKQHLLYYNSIRSNINKYCNWIIAITRDNAARINLPHKTTVIYDPVVKNRTNDHLSESFYPKVQSDLKYFTYLGGSSRIKGFEQLVNSLDYLEKDIRIFFLGQYSEKIESPQHFLKALIDPYYFRSIRLFNKIKSSKNAILIGKTQSVFNYITNSIATISCFSKPHASLPILESFSVGVPVIVSDVAGMTEFVTDNADGCFFKNKDPQSLAEAINKMSQLSLNDVRQMRQHSLEKFEEITSNNIDPRNVINQVIKD